MWGYELCFFSHISRGALLDLVPSELQSLLGLSDRVSIPAAWQYDAVLYSVQMISEEVSPAAEGQCLPMLYHFDQP